jgi:hypothetical protein
VQPNRPNPTGPVEAFPFPSQLTFEDPWRAAADEATEAYRAWCAAPPAQREDAYAVYRAAEEREAAASADLLIDHG